MSLHGLCPKFFKLLKIKNLLKNKTLVKIVKDDFTELLKRMKKIGIKLDTILSPLADNTGNIGTSKTSPHSKTTLIKHLLSDKATIREKSHSITNAMWNPSAKKPNFENFKLSEPIPSPKHKISILF